MKIDLSHFRAAFFDEAAEHLETLEAGLLRLEAEARDAELLHLVFRAAHSIKGSAGMFGLADVARFTHALESVLGRLRDGHHDGSFVATPALVTLLLQARDVLAGLVDAARSDAPAPAGTWEVMAELETSALGRRPAAGGPLPSAGDSADGEGSDWGLFDSAPNDSSVVTYRIRVVPGANMLRAGSDPFLLLRDLAELGVGGELRSVDVDTSTLPGLDALDAERCYLAWTVELETTHAESEIREVFSFVEELATVEITALGQQPAAGAETVEVRHEVAEDRRPPAEVSSDRRSGYDRRTGQHVDATSIRVATEKVDDLINLVGELVISQSMVSQLVDLASAEAAGPLVHLAEAVATLERNVRDIQERVMSIRMLPVGHLFARFPRLVRDASASLGKQVALELHGEETELDKGVIERLGDPLTHLVRNAVDHGVEGAEARRAAGKPEQAVVKLAAFHEGGSVIIEVTDDGAGLDPDKLRAKAVERGLVGADEALTTDQAHALIFRAGFSTKETVSDLSGRGVGMDVVKRNVEALNGTVSIASRPGAGTTFRIKLPLTLAILDGMQLRVGSQAYVLPLLAIVESFRPSAAEVKTVLGQGEVVLVRGEALPLFRLHALLGVADAETDPTRGLVVILEHDGRRVGLLVDELLGQAQVVVKSLESNFRRVEGVTGATIMGDGRVALILDVDGLARKAEGRGALAA